MTQTVKIECDQCGNSLGSELGRNSGPYRLQLVVSGSYNQVSDSRAFNPSRTHYFCNLACLSRWIAFRSEPRT